MGNEPACLDPFFEIAAKRETEREEQGTSIDGQSSFLSTKTVLLLLCFLPAFSSTEKNGKGREPPRPTRRKRRREGDFDAERD